MVNDTCCYYEEKEWQIQAELYTLFLCHTCCISFVTGIYFVALLGTKQVGSNHNVSDLYLGSVYSKSSLDLQPYWDFHGLLQSLQATAWILWSLPFYAFLYITHYFKTPTECTLCICYIYIFLLNLSYMFRCVIHHPQGEELRVLAQNCQLLVKRWEFRANIYCACGWRIEVVPGHVFEQGHDCFPHHPIKFIIY